MYCGNMCVGFGSPKFNTIIFYIFIGHATCRRSETKSRRHFYSLWEGVKKNDKWYFMYYTGKKYTTWAFFSLFCGPNTFILLITTQLLNTTRGL